MSPEHDLGEGRLPVTSPIFTRDYINPSLGHLSTSKSPSTPRGRLYARDVGQSQDMGFPQSSYEFPGYAEAAEGPMTPNTAPQFAEQFTPLASKARRHHAHRNRESQIPAPVAGSSQAGWFDADEGDLYRGASTHPGPLDGFSKHPIKAQPDKHGDAASIKTASSSSSSFSGLELGRRVNQAIDRVGDALHLRRGSASSTNTKTDTLTTITTRSSTTASSTSDSDSSSSSSSSEDDGATSSGIFRRRRQRRRSVRSRTASRRSQSPDALSTGTMRRRQIPTRREFTLMLPRPIGEDDISETTIIETQPSTARVRIALPSSAEEALYTGPIGISPLEQPTHDWHGRLITTPALKTVIEKIRDERKKSGYEAAFQAETEKREARERRKRKRRHHTHIRVDENNGDNGRQSSEEGRRRRHHEESEADQRTRRRTNRNRVEQLRASHEPYKVRFDNPSNPLSRHNASETALSDLTNRQRLSDPRLSEGDIIRPKSAADLLGLRDAIASSSSTSVKSLGPGAVPRPLAKRGQPFKLPPRPVFHRAQTTAGTVSSLAKPFAPNEDAPEVKKGCWWLDVSCPTWQDLRDIGEVSTTRCGSDVAELMSP